MLLGLIIINGYFHLCLNLAAYVTIFSVILLTHKYKVQTPLTRSVYVGWFRYVTSTPLASV